LSGSLLEPIDVDPAALLALHAASPDLYPALFESAAAGEPLGRFDILFAHPAGRLVGAGRDGGAISAGTRSLVAARARGCAGCHDPLRAVHGRLARLPGI
jgi:hypothetical protein